MNLRMGGQVFEDVSIPLLWGTRALLQDRRGAVSVIDLSGPRARLELLADKPAPGIEFAPDTDGFIIRQDGEDLYRYSPSSRTITGIRVHLPEVQLSESGTRVGSNFFGGNMIIGSGVGLAVSEEGIAMGAPLPPMLADLVL